MSFMNRKMFNRNARNKLNAMGGVVSFQTGGSPSMKTNPAMVFGGTNMSDVQKLALKAYNQGIGSLSPMEQTFLAQRGTTLAGRKNLPINLGADYVGRDSGIGKILGLGETALGGLRDVGATALGTIGGGLASGLTGKPDADTLSGRIGMTRPSADAMSMFGFKQVPTTVDPGLKKAMETQNIKATISDKPNIVGGPTQIGSIDVSDPSALNFIARRDEDKRVQELSKDGQLVRFNEKTGKYEIEPRLPVDPSVAEEERGIAGELGEQDIRMTPGRTQAQFGSSVLPKPTEDADKKIIKPKDKTKVDSGDVEEERGIAGEIKKDEIVEPKPTSKEQVEKLIATGSEEEQQSELKQLMSEFKQNAPKYEGIDKNLAIAKIFFSIAAGKDPDAITNISDGLNKGADMFIKDKKERDAFNRQVDLASLRYGLQERSKDRKQKFFIADKDVTVDGKKYEKGSVVNLTEGFIRKNGIPAGLTTETLTKAAMDNAATVKKSLAKLQKEKILAPKDFNTFSKRVDDAALNFTKSRNLQTLIQGQIFNVADGKITGGLNAGKALVKKAFNVAGIDAGKNYSNIEEYNRDMEEVANTLIQQILGEGSKNLSNVDRSLAQEIVGLYTSGAAGVTGYAFVDDKVLLKRLQRIHDKVQLTQQSSLAEIEDVLAATNGLTFQSGAPVEFAKVRDLGLFGKPQGATQGGKTQTIKLGTLLTDGKFDKDKFNKALLG
tara:strand:- start:824 stop:2989 length:2166 start_codon:yes stop_codon:yes gene_type:complete